MTTSALRHASARGGMMEARFQALAAGLDASPLGCCLFGSDGQPFYLNRAMIRLIGGSEDSLSGSGGADSLAALAAFLDEPLAAVLRAGGTATLDWKGGPSSADGRPRTLRLSLSPVAGGQAGARGALCVASDITPQKETEEALGLLFRQNPVPMWVYDRETLRFLAVNDAAVMAYGWSREEFLRMTILDIREPSEREQVRAAVTAPRQAYQISQNWRHVDAKGSERIVDVLSHLLVFAGRDAVLVTIWDVTDRVRVEEALRESEENHRHAIELSPQIAWVADEKGALITISPRWSRLLAMTEDEVLEMGRLSVVHPDDRAEVLRHWRRSLVSGEPVDLEARFRLADGEYRWFRSRATARRDAAGRIIRWYGMDEDIHDHRLALEALRESEEFARGVVESSVVCIKVLDLSGRLLFMNKAGETLMEIEDSSRLHGKDWLAALPAEMAAKARQAVEAARAGDAGNFTGFCPTVRGRPKWWDVIVSPVRNAAGAVVRLLVVSQDITERRQAEQQIAYLAYHDPLTGLPNRRLFQEDIKRLFAEKQDGQILALYYLDLDHFKGINDVLGHTAGDCLLQQVANRLGAGQGKGCKVYRLGGDEFALLQTGLTTAEEAAGTARHLLALLDEDYNLEGQLVAAGTSIGLALAPEHGETPESLIRNADIALYHAKSGGRGTFRFFERSMEAAARRKQMLKAGLRTALQRGELSLHFQPLVDLRSGRVTCLETLLRWHHPVHGHVSPAEFIPLAEESGLIIRIGEWILRGACAEAAQWPEPVNVAINLSAVQFRDPGLLSTLAETLKLSGLPPGRVELEITESTLLQDDQANIATLEALRGLGVRIALDDFGTGFSSLGYLLRIPFDKIKIDRSFIAGLPGRVESNAVISAVVSMGRSLSLSVTAEGVESAEQLAALRQLGCTEGQGYLFSRPVPAAKVAALLRQPPFA
ncbi:bifunctional diguanylate cyclase/phosphodiesterase [Teichococcus aestuarii]|uniref:PAS domain S-box protein n=1 Tax=Teichococcus aestuarii TaxID=568898 RepID=A0A2U1V4D7_9PROT|nr:EAL domain-containing protein [Pseudoroseomonas aestuarii]PWC28721.1 PAS domain S-box protein [Pseudoroseomonas aestuarii]